MLNIANPSRLNSVSGGLFIPLMAETRTLSALNISSVQHYCSSLQVSIQDIDGVFGALFKRVSVRCAFGTA